jgi:hypothetical protein
VKPPLAPGLENRRTAEFSSELRERAQAWIPSWGLNDSEADFGRALLDIAARFSAEVAERLDSAGEKMRRGFLDWLAVRGEAARPARVPVVFKLAETAQEAVLASAPVRLQADAAGTPVVFETEQDVRIIPGLLDLVVGADADADADAFYLPPPGLSDLQPLEPLPTEWQLKSFAAAGAKKLQLDPETGLAAEMLVLAGGQHYRLTQVDKDLVTIDPPLAGELPAGSPIRKVTTFAPFDGVARNRQEHALYLGHLDLLDIEAAATLAVLGARSLRTGVAWQYWGKVEGSDDVDWQPLTVVDDSTQPAAVVLEKPAGAIEPREIKGINSRWIRAYTTKVTGAPRELGSLEIRVNCLPLARCPAPASATIASPAAEAMANTTPLVLDNVFYPLGKEPRQFDAFYLGSQEAFSKKGAQVQLCFEMADPTFSALSVVREGTFANAVLAGVAKDRALHLFQLNATTGAITKFLQRDPLQPPLPGYSGAVEPGNAVSLDVQPRWRLPIWHDVDLFGTGFLVGVSAGAAIWVWREVPLFQNSSGWINFGQLPADTTPASDPVDGIVHLGGAPSKLAALRSGRLYLRELTAGAQWDEVETKDATDSAISLKTIVPILQETGTGLVTSAAEGMVGVSGDKKLYTVTTAGLCTELPPTDVDIEVRPVAVRDAAGDLVVAVPRRTPGDLVMFHSVHGEAPLVTLEGNPAQLMGFDVVRFVPAAGGSVLYFLASVQTPQGSYLASWIPHDAAGAKVQVFTAPVLPDAGALGGSPVQIGQRIVVPGTRADIFVSEFDPSLRLPRKATIEIGVVVPDSIPALAVGDLIVRRDDSVPPKPVHRLVTQAGLTQSGEVFYRIDADFPAGTSGLDAYDVSNALPGAFDKPSKKLTLDASDLESQTKDWLLIDNKFYTVDALNKTNVPWIATISSPTGQSLPATGPRAYVRPIKTGGRIAPYMHLDPATNGDWDAGLLARIRLIFPDENPDRQAGKAFSVALGNKPVIVVLGEEFHQPVNVPAKFVVDAAIGEWQRILGDTSTNPELSWEYWNGKGWWGLDVTFDGTLNLKTTGAVQFEVPADIASSDWAGKTNHWIRARLVGGDYGREKITTKSKTVGDVTEQTIERSVEGIRAPSVVKLHISYSVCDGVQPTFVLAQDSGSIRDQSDANRIAGAVVEAFVPLGVTLGRLANSPASPDAEQECPPECQCQGQRAATLGAPAAAVPSAPTVATRPATGRSILIGLSAAPSEAPVNILLLVDGERDHTDLAPMTIEALVADRFVPIVAEDKTRALGESGLLSMTFAVKPAPRDLFGGTLTWLRLSPVAGGTGSEWRPTLRGAYLNAVWASATETLTRELLGSSDGAPNLTFTLARPPVLQDTLELRVKEPLGDEDRAALRQGDERRVLSDVEELPGDWVLWTRVIDPGDESPETRVYAFDETTGEIRFGNGLHGAIPPIGRDSIVAFSYQRTEPAAPGSDVVPANVVVARTAFNLVTPVESVEAVVSADQAAGGAPPESDDRVLRFGFARLRHRKRAVSARDLEDLALGSSPDIVQARCLIHGDRISLIVVMRGNKPQPNAAQIRELRRLLLDSAPPSLAAPDALRIEGPAVRRLRIDLELRVASLDYAGAVARAVKERLSGLFDTATGGVDKDGWPLGENATEGDVALALFGTARLESITRVRLREDHPDGREGAWPETIKTNELVMLADDPVRLHFATAEVGV